MHSIKFAKSHHPNEVGRIVATVFAGFFAAVFIGLLFGFLLMWLWNAIVPSVFGLPTITYWQTVALFILAKFFFGFGGGGGHAHHKHKKSHREWKKWHHAKPDDGSEPPDDEILQQYWQEEGKTAFEAFLAARKASRKAEPQDPGAPPA